MSGTEAIKVMALLRRKKGVTREEFLRQWEEKHGPLLVQSLPGLRTYIQNRALPLPPHGEPPIDGFDEMWLDDLSAYRRLDDFYRSDAGKLIRDHEDEFLERGEKMVFAVDQKFIVNQGGAVKVMNYVTRKKGTTRQEFFHHWEKVHGPLCARMLPWFRTYIQDHIVPLPNERNPPFDGLDEMWVDDLESWQAVFAFHESEAGQAMRDDEAQFSDRTAVIFRAEPRVLVGSAEAQWGKCREKERCASMTKELVKPDWMSDEDWEATLDKVESLERIRRDAQAHRRVYESTGGKEGFERGAPCLLLTTIGRKTGMQITTPLNFLQERETYLVVGSLAGYDRDPGWALNLKKNPQARVQIKDKKMEVTARVVSGAERERLWVSSNQVLPLWQVFQQRTQRQFPIFVLTPKK